MLIYEIFEKIVNCKLLMPQLRKSWRVPYPYYFIFFLVLFQSEIGFGKLETYEKLEKLGEGTYATVYRGRSRLTENYVALKVCFNYFLYFLQNLAKI